MYEELIRRLREEPLDSNKAALPIMDLCIDAATAIENLSHRLDTAHGERDAVTRHMIELESNGGQIRKALHDKGFDNLDMLFEDYSQVKNELASYKNTGLEPEEIIGLENTCEQLSGINDSLFKANQEMGKDLVEWKKANDDGRLVVLPCKVGDHVWADGREAIVVWFFGYKTERYIHAQFFDNAKYTDIPFYDIGKTVFLTREEAEAALKGGDG